MEHLLLIANKRIRLNVVTGKLVLATLLFILVASATAWLGIDHYRARQALYDAMKDAYLLRLQRAMVYAETAVDLNRPPEKLSVLARGVGEQYGSVAKLKGKYGLITIASREKSNFLLVVMRRFDFTTLAALLLSLLGVFFAHNGVAGEREEGTLALTLSYTVPRYKLLLAEYLGNFISVFVPFCCGWVSFLLLIEFKAPQLLTGDAGKRYVLFFLAGAMVTAAFVGLGILASILSRQATTALIIAFLGWVGLVIIHPALSAWIARAMVPLRSEAVSFSDLTVFELAEQLDEPALTPSELDEDYANRNFEQAYLASAIDRISPYASFVTLAQILARTDIGAVRRFYEQARQANEQLRQWQEAKLRQYPRREYFYAGDWGPLDTGGIPQPGFRPETLRKSIERALAPALSLFLWAILTWTFSFIVFLRYDVRS
ncbi:MAG: DUF3526 domain-containing protein [Acidobacteria bacterium]|nr:MAG: DUF3526 domain-containing protein [Acidobacteriota bacterium]